MNVQRFETILTRVLIGLLVFMLLAIGLRFVVRQVLVKRMGMDNFLTRVVLFDAQALRATASDAAEVPVDWAARYPFPAAEAAASEDAALASAQPGAFSRLTAVGARVESAVSAVKSLFETYCTGNAPFYGAFVEAASACEGLIGWELDGVGAYNRILTLSDGMLATCSEKAAPAPYAESVAAFARALSTRGVPLLYAQAPGKVCSACDGAVSGVVDFSEQNAAALLAALSDAGVSTLDLHAALHADGLDHHAAFYATDHHWRVETGLWAAGKLAAALLASADTAFDPPLYEKSRYTAEVFPAYFLGSQGKKRTLARVDAEDFVLLYPTFPTAYTFEIPSRNLALEGDFSVQYDRSAVAVRDLYNITPYAALIYSDNALTRIENLAAENAPSLLVIKDSFADAAVPFLSLSFSRTDVLDLRLFTGSLETYLAENAYDAVLILYNPGVITGTADGALPPLFDFS